MADENANPTRQRLMLDEDAASGLTRSLRRDVIRVTIAVVVIALCIGVMLASRSEKSNATAAEPPAPGASHQPVEDEVATPTFHRNAVQTTTTAAPAKASAPSQVQPSSSKRSTTTTTIGVLIDLPPNTYRGNGVPKGATARCDDGTYVFARDREAACAHNFGVDEWYERR